jgi:hypothetical protein
MPMAADGFAMFFILMLSCLNNVLAVDLDGGGD